MCRLLIVDNDSDSAESMAMLLSLHDNECRTASSGYEGLEIAPQFQPDAIFLDLGMPGMDGVQTAQELRNQKPDYCLIALTGYGPHLLEERTIQAAFDHYLLKPVTLKQLLAIIEKLPAKSNSRSTSSKSADLRTASSTRAD